ncbi:hypothetical protein LJC59_01320 [Desulfovibrio sp. OttesenSCG-928-A18]|nr:hypothetical protein [Desulfovibrio sp. OttesenSCG-928-A18]
MCSVALATTAVATGLSMAGQYVQGQQQVSQAKASAAYNAQAAADNAAMQRQAAQNEIKKGIDDRERQQRNAARSMGEMRANMAASGLQIDSGSNLSLLGESATEHQYDSNIIRQNSEQAAWQHLVSATAADNDRSFALYQGRNAGNNGLGTALGMGGTLLGSIGAGIGQYDAWQKTNGPASAAKTQQPWYRF